MWPRSWANQYSSNRFGYWNCARAVQFADGFQLCGIQQNFDYPCSYFNVIGIYKKIVLQVND